MIGHGTDEASSAEKFDSTLWECLRFPGRELVKFDRRCQRWSQLPIGLWGGFVSIAVIGSLLYGASLGLVISAWKPIAGGLWIALSAGAAWCVFGPLLILSTGKRMLTVAHSCLVTICYGELVLAIGALINWLTSWGMPGLGLLDSHLFNYIWVGISNVVMAGMLALQFRAIGVAVWKTLTAWILILNGGGALFFSFFDHVLRGAS